MKIYLVIESCLGTDGSVSGNAYICKSQQEAGEMCESLIYTMCEDMGIEYVAGKWEIEGEGWQFNVRIQEDEI